MADVQDATERTGLITGKHRPRYAFDTSIAQERRKRVRQFQYCICVLLTCTLVMTIVVSVAYSIQYKPIPSNTTDNGTLLPVDIFLITSWPIQDAKRNVSFISDEDWFEAIAQGRKNMSNLENVEKDVDQVDFSSPSYRHQKIISPTPKARNLTRLGHLIEFATKHAFGADRKASNGTVCIRPNSTITYDLQRCLANSTCNEFQRYRSYNGTCNNLNNPDTFGTAYTPFRRMIPPDYADGISSPRVAADGKPLPSARTVSTMVHKAFNKNDQKFTVMLAVWGQFLDHDITATTSSQGPNGSTIACCNSGKKLHPECFPVLIDRDDPFYRHNVSCLEFVRSSPCPTCCLGPREQMNQVTAFIDGSVVYGTDDDVVNRLRSTKNGMLRMYVTDGNRTLLPISEDPRDGCNRMEEREKGRYCFLAGDRRANENLHLTSMQLIWARHHNTLASSLSSINPHWDDEKLFQEARRILAAQMQHITYNEFLPVLLGRKIMDKFDMNPKETGYFEGYNSSIDPTIANSFATAGFRFAHSIIPGMMKVLGNDTSSPEYLQMHKLLLNPFKLYEEDELDKALKSAMGTSIQANDPYFTNELKQHLFERSSGQNVNKTCGLDLVSLNIQRGRDHGLPGYTSWREHCGLQKPRSFDDLAEDIDHDSLNNIRSIYRHVDDIDLYSGALSEKPLDEGILGPTVTCLLLDQFVRLKRGDRFWYENPGKFTPKQLDEIRKTTLAGVICDNSDNVEYVQPRVMEQSSGATNKNVPCSNIAAPDLNPWKDGDLPAVPLLDAPITVRGINAT